MRLLAAFAVGALAMGASLFAGCGSAGESTSTGSTAPAQSSGGAAAPGASTTPCVLSLGRVTGLRTTGVSCSKAQKVPLAWGRSAGCTSDPGASRSSCTVSGYRCLGTQTDRGLTVSCSQRGRTIAFTVKSPFQKEDRHRRRRTHNA
jgi:hypothetical protein